MSSRNSEETSDFGYQESLLIGGSLIALMVGLMIMKYFLFVVLDVCCEVDGGTRRRVLRDFFRKLFPFWHVRTQPSATQQQQQQRDSDRVHSPPLTPERIREILPIHVLTEEEVKIWKEKHSKDNLDLEKQQETSQKEQHQPEPEPDQQSGDENKRGNSNCDESEESSQFSSRPCSICLQGMEVGDEVYKATSCGHIFHFNCLAQWVLSSSSSSSSNSNSFDCPNCRTQIDH
mmetsp:Transcript_14662/g.19137  ORF Transcript_14662/g.19137 Transcript_14662/m.19137 type:complete len:232 (+) Transcript_14662:308-1003(+)